MTRTNLSWSADTNCGGLSIGLTTVPEIPNDISLPVTGEIPTYLNGRLFRNGPGLYEVTHKNGEVTHIHHWFDGIATVHRFRIDGPAGTVQYKNRRTMPDVVAAGEAAASKSEYKAALFGAQDPCRGLLGNLFQMWRPYSKAPGGARRPINASVTLERIPGAGKLVARTDLNAGAVLDIDTLQNEGDFSFAALNPSLGQLMSAAHGVADPDTGEYFNYCFNVGKPPVEYSVFAQAAGGKNRVLAKINEAPRYLHSLTATKNYVVLIMYSVMVNPLKLLTGCGYVDGLQFRPDIRTKFYVVSRAEEKVAAVYDADAFFCFHNINAFEDAAGNLQLDLVWIENGDVLLKSYRTLMVQKSTDWFGEAKPKRFTLADIASTAAEYGRNPDFVAEASVRLLADVDIELPTISPLYSMRDYRYTYGVSSKSGGMLFNSLVKTNVVSGECTFWSPEDAACGEPIFVPKPASQVEDEGTLLSVVLDLKEERSFMVILDAQTMTEVARATVPQPVPLGFHGQFMEEEFAQDKSY